MTIITTQLEEYITLLKSDITGIAVIENRMAGCVHSCHPNIDVTGSVSGLKKQGYWEKKDRTVRFRHTIYNVDSYIVSDHWDKIAAENCDCIGCLSRRAKKPNDSDS